ncbi:cysteine desulfurase family protein [Spirosoma spitsbergense]|uniref:cysteine desulfurase family protein n=1 Tax=Spirosoma spitsbergense TaxID=431554 RepID=UPI0003798A7A|nr:cysteine desulfurase family protein [Spirosoma spitsbergense]
MNYPAYFDYNATTPVDPLVLDAMLPYFGPHFGNAASRTHVFGAKAEEAVDEARQQLADLLEANPKEVVFTSGATESINLALKGVWEASQYRGPNRQPGHIITVSTEHKAVLDTCEHLSQLGAEITYLQPASDGLITANQLEAAIKSNTVLVSVMAANNETGVLQPIQEIGEIAYKYNVLFHTDATQAIGKMSLSFANSAIDLLSLSGHKFYGPKGVGALLVRNGVRLSAQQDGGRHERGRRSGTLNVPGIIGMGEAAQLAQRHMLTEAKRIVTLRDQLEAGILANLANVSVNGSKQHRLPNTTNICFAGVDGELLLLLLNELAVSNGSACTSASTDPSHVLSAMGLSDDLAYSSVRFSLGRFTTEAEVEAAIRHVIAVVGKLC